MENNTGDDSGCQAKRKYDDTQISNADEGANVKRPKACNSVSNTDKSEIVEKHNLLHFSDDVMLCILDYCNPGDLKALSFCCRRLARLCMDRSLWRNVELRNQALGTRGLWFYARCLNSGTSSLRIRGLVGTRIEEKGMRKCPGNGGTCTGPNFCECINPDYIDLCKSNSLKLRHLREKCMKRQKNVSPSDAPPTPTSSGESSQSSSSATSGTSDSQPSTSKPEREGAPSGHSSILPGKVRKENGNTSPKPFSAAYEDYPTISHVPKTEPNPPEDDDKWETEDDKLITEPAECCKYRSECIASLTKFILNEIKLRCVHLKDLRIEYCNLDCNPLSLADLPKSLKKLSLKGCKKTNIPFQKTFLFKIKDHLPGLEELDLSYCFWISGHTLLILSKMLRLRKLWLRGCICLGECVAYASLSTRFGFKALEFLDIRGTSIGDSEVSSFGSLVSLRELYLEPPPPDSDVNHIPVDWPAHSGAMESWETDHPFKEVEEYINMVNGIVVPENNGAEEAKPAVSTDSTSKNETTPSSSANANRTEREANRDSENFGIFYRSVLNVSFNALARVPPNEGNDNAQRNNDEADQQNPPPVPERPPRAQVAPPIVQVAARVHVRQPAEEPQAEPRNIQPGAGNVDVQLGPDGVHVDLGGVVDDEWPRNPPDVQVEVGGVRVNPGWVRFGPQGLQVDFGDVQVPVPEQGQRPPGRADNAPVEVQIGPIELEVAEVSFEVGGEGRRPAENNPPPRERQYPEYPPPPAPHQRPNRNQRGDENGHDFHADMQIDPVWMHEDINRFEEGLENRRMLHVHVRRSFPRLNVENRADEEHPNEAPVNQPPRPGDGNGNEEQQEPMNRLRFEPQGMQWMNIGNEGGVRVAVGEMAGPRGLYRVSNINVQAGHRAGRRQNQDDANGDMRRRMRIANAHFRRAMEYIEEQDRQNQDQQQRQQQNQNRQAPPAAAEYPRAERHNIMDGRVHVIYVDPRHPRRMPPAEVLVAAGFPRQAAVMMVDENMWQGAHLRRLGGSELVTDVSLLRLGDSEQLVHVGPGGNNRRRCRNSRLEVLVCRGYRGVTDRSLVHLAAAAPLLRHLDVENCGVTMGGVSGFTMVRPDCAIVSNCTDPPPQQPPPDPPVNFDNF